MIDILKKLSHVLDRSDKLFLPVAVLMAIIFSVLEMISIGVLLPYAEMIVNPEKMQENPLLGRLMGVFAVDDIRHFLFMFSFVLLGIYVFKLFYSTFFTYVQLKFGRRVYDKTVRKIFDNIVKQPYLNFIKTNTADYTKALLQEANGTVAMIPMLLIILSEFLTIALLFGMLLLTNWKVTLIICSFFIAAFCAMSQTITRWIKDLGTHKSHLLGQVYRAIDEAFGNIKILKLNCQEGYGRKKFLEAAQPYNQIQVVYGTLQTLPRNIIEFIGFCAFIIIVIFGAVQGGLKNLLPILTVFALSFFRMLPSINRVMSSYNQIVYYHKSIDIIHDFLNLSVRPEKEAPLAFDCKVELRNISFAFTPGVPILQNIDMNVSKGSKIGIVGPSGCGKSTLIDILSGLIEVDTGTVYVDNEAITHDNIRSWRKKIGYIPQTIYLFDGTVAENICLGFGYDEARITEVLQKANIYEFLQTKDGIHTKVGENGVMLSGGQKQRIAIARALYTDPEILILDEATSALDSATEERIINEIFEIAEHKTVIMVAHRLSTLKKCDMIYEVQDGSIIDVSEKCSLRNI